jgi:hypothetical protein
VAVGADVGLSEVLGLAVGVALPVDVALSVADAELDAEALPVEVADPDGEGVLDPVPVWELAEICGVGVKTDDGPPPPVQPATATAARLAPAVARTARRHTLRVTADRVTADRVTADRVMAGPVTADRVTAGPGTVDPVTAERVTAGPVAAGRISAGRVATGTVRRTFMKPPRISGGQWHRSTHLSICHPDRQGKSERANSQPPFRPAGEIPGAGRPDVRIDDHI